MNTVPLSVGSNSSSTAPKRRMVASEQPKRIASCQCSSGSTSRSGNAPTDWSMSSTTGRFARSFIAMLRRQQLPVAFEMPAELAQQGAQQGVAGIHGVAGEGHAGTEEGLDLRVSPARHVVGQAAPARIVEIVHPADKIQIVLACLRIGEADVFVDQLAGVLVAKIPADHLAGMTIDKDDAAAGRILQHRAEKVGARAIE